MGHVLAISTGIVYGGGPGAMPAMPTGWGSGLTHPMPTWLFHHPSSVQHDTGYAHPESAERMTAVTQALAGPQCVGLERRTSPAATADQVDRAHQPGFFDRLAAAVPPWGLHGFDSDTMTGPQSLTAALTASGGACAAVDAVATGAAENAFVAARPPGHHAERHRPMGFCLTNHVAIAAQHARAQHGLDRIAVVDFDVHHGNGTQDCFWDEPGLLYASIHQMPLYPGTGTRAETGARGMIVNSPLPPGAGADAFRAAVQDDVLPALQSFAPDLLILSAGFDAHRADPLANLCLDVEDFGWVTDQLCAAAASLCQGRLVSVLEGGYDPVALAASVAAHIEGLVQAAARP